MPTTIDRAAVPPAAPGASPRPTDARGPGGFWPALPAPRPFPACRAERPWARAAMRACQRSRLLRAERTYCGLGTGHVPRGGKSKTSTSPEAGSPGRRHNDGIAWLHLQGRPATAAGQDAIALAVVVRVVGQAAVVPRRAADPAHRP